MEGHPYPDPDPFSRRVTDWLARNTPTWVVGVVMLATMAQWAYYYGMVLFYLGRYAIFGH